jgi:hypothetical protein
MEYDHCKNAKFRCAVYKNIILNDEIRMTNDEIKPNGETPNLNAPTLWDFVIVVSSFGFRASSFSMILRDRAAHSCHQSG